MKIIPFIAVLALFTQSYSQQRLNSSLSQNTLLQQPEIAEIEMIGGWDFNINLLPYSFIEGTGMRLGSKVTLFQEATWEDINNNNNNILFDSRTDYGDRIVPIISDPEYTIPFNISAGYTYNEMRIGLSWQHLSTSYSESGMVPGLDFREEEQSEFFSYGLVSFWNMGWDLHASRGFPASWVEGFRDLDNNEQADYQIETSPEEGATLWDVTHNTSFNNFQLSLTHPLLRTGNMRLNMTGGINYGRWTDNLEKRLDITAYRAFTDRWTELLPLEEENDSILVEIFWTDVFHNEITLETNSGSEFNAFGILAGFQADLRILPLLSLEINAGASSLSGIARFSGTGIDIDDIAEIIEISFFDTDGNHLFTDQEESTDFLSGEFDLPEFNRSVLSVNYFMNLSVSYEIIGNVSLRAGYWYSQWTDLPGAPRWTYSDRQTRPYGAFAVEESWEKERRSPLSVSGFSFGLGLRF